MTLKTEEEIRTRWREVLARIEGQGHMYDKGYADALAWILGEKAGDYE